MFVCEQPQVAWQSGAVVFSIHPFINSQKEQYVPANAIAVYNSSGTIYKNIKYLIEE